MNASIGQLVQLWISITLVGLIFAWWRRDTETLATVILMDISNAFVLTTAYCLFHP